MVCVLLDIRDELQQLNRVFACHNFQAMPHEMRRLRHTADRLDRRLAKKVPLKNRRPK